MGHKPTYGWLVGLLAACAIWGPSVAVAGDLDSCDQFRNVVHDRLGYTGSSRSWTQIDSTTDALTALNMALRDVATDIGIPGHDTITVVAETDFYALVSTYMDKELPHMPLRVFHESANGVELSEMWRVGRNQLGQGSGVTVGWQYALAGNRLWIAPPTEDGDNIYIEGPLEATTFSHGASTTNVSEEDKHAVVYRAVALIARAKEKHRMADYFEMLYGLHLQSVLGAPTIATP